ncbi:hypothetical protein NQU17_00175 [Clostridiaceae bacterium HFYG-1003]|nr:hypothetical protein NQU17_00175 [Clostridiaceae bacterium HFYG-1003]
MYNEDRKTINDWSAEMTHTIVLLLISFLVLLAVLAVDYYFYRTKKTIYMTNQSHVNLYVVPFLLSFVLFTIAISGEGMTPIGLTMLLIFLGVYIYILTYDKIILMGADLDDVTRELDEYLKESGRSYRIFPSSELSRTVEINNYRNALIIRDADKWIEIDNHIHYDEAFVADLNDHFRKRASTLKKKRIVPNFFFYVLVLFIIGIAAFFCNFYLTHGTVPLMS